MENIVLLSKCEVSARLDNIDIRHFIRVPLWIFGILQKHQMYNIKFVQSFWNFPQLKKNKQVAKIWSL